MGVVQTDQVLILITYSAITHDIGACVKIRNMKTKKINGKLKVIAVSLLIVFALGFCLTLSHWWLIVPTAQILYNGKPSTASHLYRSRNGEFILRVSEPSEFAYWITPKDQKVYSPNFSNFSFFTFAVFVDHNDHYGVDLESTGKTEITPNIIADKDSVEFTGLRKQRIHVSW